MRNPINKYLGGINLYQKPCLRVINASSMIESLVIGCNMSYRLLLITLKKVCTLFTVAHNTIQQHDATNATW